jgi:hypothetical protein
MEDTVERLFGDVGEWLARGQEHNVEIDLRILLAKGIEQFRGDRRAELAGRAHAQGARHLLAHLRHRRCRIVAIRLNEPGVAQELRARVGHMQLMTLAHEELDAELILQLPDLVAEC